MSTNKIQVTAVILTKDEETALPACLDGLVAFEQVIVVDSASADHTVQIANEWGAEVVQFSWNRKYPKKKQWALQHPAIRHDWVLLLDADEIVRESLAEEIRAVTSGESLGGFDIPLEYHFGGRALRHGHRVTKRSLLNRNFAAFPDVGDLDAPGITEVEGHYQPRVTANSVGRLKSRLVHLDPDPLSSWVSRHNKYSEWEAFLVANPDVGSRVRESRSRQGQVFDRIPAKPLVFFAYSYFLRLGLLDGRQGFDYAFALSFYYWLIRAKVREGGRIRT
jgi:glycosyltransferase involved in cell wall biosynthesis